MENYFIDTDIDWKSVVLELGFNIIQIKTTRQGLSYEIHKNCTEETIIENFYYILSNDDLLKLNLDSLVDYSLVMENRTDIWWRRFYSEKMTALLKLKL